MECGGQQTAGKESQGFKYAFEDVSSVVTCAVDGADVFLQHEVRKLIIFFYKRIKTHIDASRGQYL